MQISLKRVAVACVVPLVRALGIRSWTTAVMIGILLLFGCVAAVPPPDATSAARGAVVIDRWSDRYPEASQALGDWVARHPAAARKFFEWDSNHTGRAHDFVTWTIFNRNRSIDEFVRAHPQWPVFQEIMDRHRPAAESFANWCRHFPDAAESLMNHPGGLDWAGRHLYRAYWQMKEN
jgi:hypothetical protein